MDTQRKRRECPFLKEEKVVFCRAFPVKKMLPLEKIFDKENMCLRREHRSCPVYLEKMTTDLSQGKICHFLGTENIVYCQLAPVKKMIPIYSLKFEGPCSNESYVNCAFYQKMLQGDQKVTDVQGFVFDDTLYYYAGHIWLKRLEENVRIGLDDFGQFIIGNVREVLLPIVGDTVRAEEPFMSLRCDDGTIDLISPVEGTVSSVNRAVEKDCTLINLDPYGDGWLAEIREVPGISSFEEEGSTMFHGDATAAWLEQEVYNLRHFIQSEIGVTVADGGKIWRGLRAAFDNKGNLLVKKFFDKKRIRR
jgi:glycine cleavage system H protein